MSVAVIVVAAGSGERLGYSTPKAFVTLGGRTLLEHALTTVTSLARKVHVIVVAPPAWKDAATELSQKTLSPDHNLRVVVGGETRSDSVRNGLAELPDDCETVLIHDAARSLCPPEVFERVIARVEAGAKGVIPILDVVDTLSPVEPGSEVTGPAVDRERLAVVQTPQGFARSVISDAHHRFPDDATDDADIVRRAGYTVVGVSGDPRAFKITHPADLERAEHLVAPRGDLRTGIGVDVHAYDPNSPLWLGGVLWEGEPGLSGHSDGDAVIHAICDALLQAASLGDLGTLFGESRPEFDGARSTVFLAEVVSRVKAEGFTVSSVSCQLVANTPRFAPRRVEVSELLSDLVGAPVHVAATTSDGLGLTGRGEGAAAFAVALLARHRPAG